MDTKEKAFEYASETSKLLITLSTGIIAFLIAFLDKDAMLKPDSDFDKFLVGISWILLLGSAIVGVWTQLGITNVLEPKPEDKNESFIQTIRNEKIKFPFKIQIVLFALGIITTVLYGIIGLIFID